MRAPHRHSYILTVLLLLPLAACAPADDAAETEAEPASELPAPAPRAPAELTAASDAYIAAWNGEDMGAVSEFFLDDATARVGDDTFNGKAEIEAGWLKELVPAVQDLVINETVMEQRGADWYSEGTYTHAPTETGPRPGNASGRYATTWARTPEGQWRIRSTEITPDGPAPDSAAPAPAPQN